MNSLNSWLPTQWFTLAALLLVVGVILVIVSMFAWRAISRPHVRASTKAGRQTRLGVVDKHDVGVRQLVLVRRDNVEHLIMIGGPNDLLIESTILKARPGAQAPRSAGAVAAAPTVLPERVADYPAPRQVEEDFAKEAEVTPPVVAKIEQPTTTPAPTTTAPPSPATTAGSSGGRSSVVPPREPGFFQRASSRFQTKASSGATAPAAVPVAGEQAEDEPRANIDTAHFEELLGASEHGASPAATTPAAPAREFDFDGTDIESAPEEAEPATTPQPTTTRLTLPEIRLPDLKLPEWRRPEPAASTAPPPASRLPETRVEPRFSSESRPLGGGRIEPPPATPEVRTTEAPARHEPFRVGERLTTPTRATTAPAASTTPAPAEPEDPFASLEEEMASLLGRTRDDSRRS